MQSIQTSSAKLRLFQYIACINLLLLAGCSSSTQDLFADSLGVVPDSDTQQLTSSEETKTAINELTVKDPTARAALGREEVVPEEEKKKIAPQAFPLKTNPKTLNTSPSTFNQKNWPRSSSLTTENIAQLKPVKLNQLYFDNQKKYSDDSLPTPLVKLVRTSYTQNVSPHNIPDLQSASGPISKLESLAARANQKMTGANLPTYTLPITLIAFGLILGSAVFGYKWELKRIEASERSELAKKNLWNKGLTELLPPR